MPKFKRKDRDQLTFFLRQKEADLRRYSAYDTKERDRKLANGRGGIEAILQGLESIIDDINRQVLWPSMSVTQAEMDELAERATKYVADARRLLNQPRGTYRPDANSVL